MFNNFRDSKNLLIGCLAVCFGVFVLIFSTYTVVEHGLKAGDISRSRNRQRVSPVQRLTSEKVMRCMKMLPDFQEKWRATYEWTKIMHTYQDIMLNPKLTWGERISGGSLVVHFLRYWRSAVSKIPGQTLQHHFVTSETHMDIEISVGCLVNLIGCWKDFDLADHPPFIPNLGSEACECLFGKLSGWVVHKHSQSCLGTMQIIQQQSALLNIEHDVSTDGSAFSYRKPSHNWRAEDIPADALPDRAERNARWAEGKLAAFKTVCELVAGSCKLDLIADARIVVPKCFLTAEAAVKFQTQRRRAGRAHASESMTTTTVETATTDAPIDMGELEVDDADATEVIDLTDSALTDEDIGFGPGSVPSVGCGAGSGSSSESTCDGLGDADVDEDISDEVLACCLRASEVQAGSGADGLTGTVVRNAVGNEGMDLLRSSSYAHLAVEIDELVAAEKAVHAHSLKRTGMTMMVEGPSPDTPSTEHYVASVLSLLNTKPMASPDRAVRIIRTAQEQLASAPAIESGIVTGSIVLVLFQPGFWFGEVYRYGPQTSGRGTVRDWQFPIDTKNLPNGAEAIRLQLFWLYPIGDKPDSSGNRLFQLGPADHSPVELASVIEVVSMSASKQNDHHVYSITASEYDRLVAKTEEVRASMPESAGSRRDMLAPASRPPPSIRDVDVITLPARTTAPVQRAPGKRPATRLVNS